MPEPMSTPQLGGGGWCDSRASHASRAASRAAARAPPRVSARPAASCATGAHRCLSSALKASVSEPSPELTSAFLPATSA